MTVTNWLDHQQRRRPALGFPIAVAYKYLDDQGAYLAALITYYGFISIFPLFLLLSSILGSLLQSYPEWQTRIMDSAVAQIPVIGTQIQRQQLQGSTAAVIVGFLFALYGALGVAQAIQFAMNSAWAIPRNSRPNPFLARLKSLGLLSVLGISTLLSTLLSQLPATLASFGVQLGRAAEVLGTLGSLLISFALFTGMSRIGIARYVGLRTLLPGALLGALFWQLLQSMGGSFVRTFVASSSAVNGIFAIVLGLIAWLYLAATALMVSVEVNVVLAKRLYPRSLLTPLTDNVDLTPADQRAYAGRARAQRLKGFQRVDVSFEHDGQYASAQRLGQPRSDPGEAAASAAAAPADPASPQAGEPARDDAGSAGTG